MGPQGLPCSPGSSGPGRRLAPGLGPEERDFRHTTPAAGKGTGTVVFCLLVLPLPGHGDAQVLSEL